MKYNTIRQYINIVRILHLEWGVANPMENNYQLAMTLRGIRRVLGDATTKKEPADPKLLMTIFRNMNIGTPRAASVWAAALMMFYGLLRRSNVIPAGANTFDQALHLRRQDVVFTRNGVIITVRWSKTNQYRSRVREIPLPRIAGHPLCPAQAAFHAVRITPAAPPGGPMFIDPRPGQPLTPLTADIFWQTIRGALAAAGVNTSSYGSHSFRRGGSCWLFNIGMPEGRIRELGDWRSNAYVRYVTADTDSLAATTKAMAAALPPPAHL